MILGEDRRPCALERLSLFQIPALRQVSNRLVGILHGCLKTSTRYNETTAWPNTVAHPQGQKPLSIVITAGQRGDSRQFQAVLDGICVPRRGPGRPRTRPDRVLGDKAYGSRANRGYLRQRSIKCTIPEKADQVRHRKNRGRAGGRPPAFDREHYKQRHAVECGINRLTRNWAPARQAAANPGP